MPGIYGYDVTKGDFSEFPSAAAWEAQLTVPGIKQYLRDHLRAQLEREIPPAAKMFRDVSAKTGIGVGFWLLARAALTPISFLGALYKGSDSSANAIAFMEEYLGRRLGRTDYERFSALLFTMYRHGLVHLAAPRSLERVSDGLILHWGVSHEPADHFAFTKNTDKKRAWLTICPEALCADLVGGIDHYASDFDVAATTAQLVTNFKTGFLSMAAYLDENDSKIANAVKPKLRSALAAL
jgi:hypothetical protein